MAKKTNKTSHVLNLISNRTGLSEEEIAPEAASKPRPAAAQTQDAPKKRVPLDASSPQTVEDLLAEDIPDAPPRETVRITPSPRPSLQEERSDLESFSPQESYEEFEEESAYEEPYYNEPSLPERDGFFASPTRPEEMNVPSSPKAFADAISAAQQALADTLPSESQSSSLMPSDNFYNSTSSSLEKEPEPASMQETWYYQEPAPSAQPQAPVSPQIPEQPTPAPANPTTVYEQPSNQQPTAPKRTFADLVPSQEPPVAAASQGGYHSPVSQEPSPNSGMAKPVSTFADLLPPAQSTPAQPAEGPATFADLLARTAPIGPEQVHPQQPVQAAEQPIGQPPYIDQNYQTAAQPTGQPSYPGQGYQAAQQPMGQPPYPAQGYPTAPQGQPGYYPTQNAPQPANGYYNQPQGQYGQNQYGQPVPSQIPGQPTPTPQPIQMPAQGQSYPAPYPAAPQMQHQSPGYQSQAVPFSAGTQQGTQPPVVTPYDGPKTAKPSLVNALFGKPGSKKAAPVLMDDETPDPRLFQPFDVSSAILKNIEDYVDNSAAKDTAAASESDQPERRTKLMENDAQKTPEKISFRKGPFQDPAKSYTFMSKNIMEDLVINQMFDIMEKFGMCTCNECANDVLALALNALPPKYVVSKQTSLYVKLAATEKQYGADIVSAITQACVLVQKNPRHEARE